MALSEFAPRSIDGHRFGYGTFFIILPPTAQEEEVLRQAKVLGYSNGCPLTNKLTNPGISPHGKNAPERMMRRYAAVNQVNCWVWDIVGRYNPDLYRQMSMLTVRRLSESVGEYEPPSVPISHLDYIYPMSGLVGSSVPRIVLACAGESLAPLIKTRDKCEELVEDLVGLANTPLNFLARLSERALWLFDKPDILGTIAPRGILEEENCYHEYSLYAQELQEYAPNVVSALRQLKPSEKSALNIADLCFEE